VNCGPGLGLYDEVGIHAAGPIFALAAHQQICD
jgi:hypothetical protein